MLSTRTRIILPTSTAYITDPDDPNLIWSVDNFFVDMLVCVGRDIGLGPLLPSSNIDCTFEFELEPTRRSREFKAKHAHLGFNPTESMLWAGRTQHNEDVFFALVPRAPEENEEDSSSRQRSSVMPELRYRQFFMFLAYAVSQCTDRGIVVYDKFPRSVMVSLDDDDDEPPPLRIDDKDFDTATNMQ